MEFTPGQEGYRLFYGKDVRSVVRHHAARRHCRASRIKSPQNKAYTVYGYDHAFAD